MDAARYALRRTGRGPRLGRGPLAWLRALCLCLVALGLPRGVAAQVLEYGWDIYYTTGAAGGSLKRASVRAMTGAAPVVTERAGVATLGEVAGVAIAPDGDVLVAAAANRVHKVNPVSGVATPVTAAAGGSSAVPAVFTLFCDPNGEKLWVPVEGSSIVRMGLAPTLAVGSSRALSGADAGVAHLAWLGGVLYYAAQVEGIGIPAQTSFGTLDEGSFSTRRLLSGLPPPRGLVADGFTGHLLLFTPRSVVQIDPRGGPLAPLIVSVLDLAPTLGADQIVAGASDGQGRIVAATEAGRLVVLELAGAALVGDPGVRRHALTLEPAGAVRSIAPLSGPGSSRPSWDLWDNGPFDGLNGQASQVGTFGGDPRTADDFYLLPGRYHRLDHFTATFLSDTLIPSARLELYEDRGGAPGALLRTFAATSVTDTSDRFESLRVLRAVFPTPGLWLPGGRSYWVSAVGVGSATGTDQWYWATSGNGRVKGTPGKFRAPLLGHEDWVSVAELGCGCTDFAFTVSGEPCKVLFDGGEPDPAGTGALSITAAPSAESRAADNFVVPPCATQTVCFVRAIVYTNCVPARGRFELYAGDCPGPAGAPLLSAPYSKVVDLGYSVSYAGFSLRAYAVEGHDLNWTIAGGRNYWLAAVGDGGNALNRRSVTAYGLRCEPGDCGVRFGQAMVKNRLFGDQQWTPVEALAGEPRDLAFLVAVELPTPAPDLAAPVLTCAADFDRSGAVTVDDVFAFLRAWFAGCP